MRVTETNSTNSINDHINNKNYYRVETESIQVEVLIILIAMLFTRYKLTQ